MSNRHFFHFAALPLSTRMVYTMTLLVLGTGYLFAMLQVFFSHAGLDGNPKKHFRRGHSHGLSRQRIRHPAGNGTQRPDVGDAARRGARGDFQVGQGWLDQGRI
jgi:hypothetical protein